MERAARAARLIGDADALLRGIGPYAAGRGQVPWRQLVVLVCAGGCIYGAAMGVFGVRVLQALCSASKVPLLLGGATVVCLPNFYVVNVLLGLRDDFSAACRGVFAAQATLAVVLAGFVPVTLFVYAQSGDYDQALAWNGIVFLAATVAGQVTLSRHYRPLIARDSRHRVGKAAWMVLYVFVAIQLAWVLRPFVGAPGMPTRFLREGAWSNAYVEVVGIVARLLGG